MTNAEYNDALRLITMRALQAGKMDVAQIIGSLEIAKLNVDRMMIAKLQSQQATGIVPAILPPPRNFPGQ